MLRIVMTLLLLLTTTNLQSPPDLTCATSALSSTQDINKVISGILVFVVFFQTSRYQTIDKTWEGATVQI